MNLIKDQILSKWIAKWNELVQKSGTKIRMKSDIRIPFFQWKTREVYAGQRSKRKKLSREWNFRLEPKCKLAFLSEASRKGSSKTVKTEFSRSWKNFPRSFKTRINNISCVSSAYGYLQRRQEGSLKTVFIYRLRSLVSLTWAQASFIRNILWPCACFVFWKNFQGWRRINCGGYRQVLC